MSHFDFTLKRTLLGIALLALPLFTYLIWTTSSSDPTLATLTKTYATPGTSVKQDLQSIPSLPFTQEDTTYTMTDTTSDGISIQFANHETESNQPIAKNTNSLALSFPKNYTQPVSIKLDDQRTIEITDLGGKSDYVADTLTQEETVAVIPGADPGSRNWFQKIRKTLDPRVKPEDDKSSSPYLRYTSKDGRKQLLYAYQKDQANGEKKLKHWTLYKEGDGIEKEEYQFKNAKLKVNGAGGAEVFYYGEQELKNDQAVAEVDTNLLERAQRTLAKEMGEDLLNGNHTPDFTIPAPYYLDRNGDRHEAQWKWNEETSTLSVNFTPEQNLYPVALDPTLSFTAPGVSNGGSVITGEEGLDAYGTALLAGDFNTDGRTDLIVGAIGGGSVGGRVYIFYGDGTFTQEAQRADVMIDAVVLSDQVGNVLAAGDFNVDGRMDFAMSGDYHNHVWIFYNDGAYPTTTATADVHLSGDESSYYFGRKIVAGDFNADGKTDIAVGADDNATQTGRAYVFYADGTNNYGTATCTGSLPTTCLASNADVKITGETTGNYFGFSLASGDFNMDGKTDLVVGSYGYSSNIGRAYIFYSGSIVTENASGADVIITGSTAADRFGASFASGDFNADGQTDVAVGAPQTAAAGKAYLFYGDGSIPTTAATADVTITGKAGVYGLGKTLAAGDMNSDGRMDLVVGATYYTADTGDVFLFYNDGVYPSNAANADVIMSGQAPYHHFGDALVTGDFNMDGKVDLGVGAPGYRGAVQQGRAYIFYSQNGQVNTNKDIAGETTSNYFGAALTAGDFNSDGRTDLVVGSYGYSSSAGRVYIFYGDGQIPSTAATADVTITGNTASDLFGSTLTAGDFNADGTTDLAVGATGYASSAGRVYIFNNDGSIPATAATADVTITGESSFDSFGVSLSGGDFNADGKIDLAVGANTYGSNDGRAYIFHNGSIITENASGADVVISGVAASSDLGTSLISGDFNSDGKTDLVAAGDTGDDAYIFYNGAITTESASGADVTITGSGGYVMESGDFNTDGRIDLAVGDKKYSSSAGRVYIYYNDGSIPTTVGTADITITGSVGSNRFAASLAVADFNADGRTDLAVGANGFSTATGHTYLFYNDGSIPTTSATADIDITGEASGDFGWSLAAGDFNADGRVDLIVGDSADATNTGKVYFYETRENFAWDIQKQFGNVPRTGTNGGGQEMQITGETGSQFGWSLTTGDLNTDGRIDLVVGADISGGSLYIFYDGRSLVTGASSADIVIRAETSGDSFGRSVITGDFNADGRIDLASGADGYAVNNIGRAYIFYNDGSYPATAAAADVIIAGAAASDYFGYTLIAGDFNADSKTDIVATSLDYSSNTGRAYIFYNGSIITENASGADVIITGETFSNLFGASLASGDFNTDGKVDLAIGSRGYSSSTGRIYIFYNGSIITENASGADIIITGETTSNYFGAALTSGDWNADGKIDLGVGANRYSTYTGRAYIFYNGSIITENASGADVIITGEATNNHFGVALTSGDWNADGRIDLAVGASGYATDTGRAYVFYSGSIITENASGADVIITGETTSNYFSSSLVSGDLNADGKTDLAVGANGYSSIRGKVYLYTFNDPVITGEATNNYFGLSLSTGDFNADGKTDLAVGARGYSTNAGRAYIFYNDGSFPTTTATADIIITGESSSQFGFRLGAGDFNADGKVDLVVGAIAYSSNAGRAYIFYNGSIITENASGADIIITGESGSGFGGGALSAGDFNADGKTDLAVSAIYYSSFDSTGRAYIFYNGSIITENASGADIILTGEATSNLFGYSLSNGDFNADGKTDLAVGAYFHSSGGRAYIFYNGSIITENASGADVILTSETTSNRFGTSLAAGDWNADGRTDLVVGASGYSTDTGRAYIFYNGSIITENASGADVIITGETTSNSFGGSFSAGDFNADGKVDLAISAPQYSTQTGRVYVFYNGSIITENASGADIILTGEVTNSSFGQALNSGDFNLDGKVDLVAGAYGYSTNTGRVYMFTSEVAGTSVPPGTSYLKGTGKLKGTMKWK